MRRQQILEELVRIAAEKLGRTEEISEDTRLAEDLRLDSLALLTLAIEIENHFRLLLDEEGVAGIETVGEIVDAIEAAQQSEPGA